LSKGKDIVLLCHEGEEFFCHRQLVSKWLIEKLNIQVLEFGKRKEINEAAKEINEYLYRGNW